MVILSFKIIALKFSSDMVKVIVSFKIHKSQILLPSKSKYLDYSSRNEISLLFNKYITVDF